MQEIDIREYGEGKKEGKGGKKEREREARKRGRSDNCIFLILTYYKYILYKK